MIASGLEPESGTAQDLQLERLPLAADQEGLREGVRRRGRGDVLRDDGRGDREDLVGRGRLRRLLPDQDRIGPPRHREDAAAAEPRLPPESREDGLARVAGPVVRQGLAVHRSVRHCTTGIGYRTDKIATTPRELLEPVRDLLGRGEQGEDLRPRRQPRAPIGHMLLKNGITNINTENPDEIELAKNELHVAHRRREREVLDRRLHEPPERSRLGAPDVVGQRDLAPSTLPRGRRPRGARLLVPAGRTRD